MFQPAGIGIDKHWEKWTWSNEWHCYGASTALYEFDTVQRKLRLTELRSMTMHAGPNRT